ncbi:unnamed protein product [Oreochromis niloticus]|nr:unnamed protein product [Mustela putorius furo]
MSWSASNPDEVITVKQGEDVTLQCWGFADAPIELLEWSRPELTDYVFYYREQRSYEKYQHPSYKGRVKLRDPEMKNGDVSVILKEVTFNDTGRYECLVGERETSGAPSVSGWNRLLKIPRVEERLREKTGMLEGTWREKIGVLDR